MLLPLLVANDNPPTPSIAPRSARRVIVDASWIIDDRRREGRRRLPIEPPVVPPPPPPPAEHVCYPRLEIGSAGFARQVLSSNAYERQAIVGAYTREGVTAFSGTRLGNPAGVPTRMDDPDCAHPIGYGDDYGFDYGGTS